VRSGTRDLAGWYASWMPCAQVSHDSSPYDKAKARLIAFRNATARQDQRRVPMPFMNAL
jgi:hypothetical protein